MAFGPRGFLIDPPEAAEAPCFGLFDAVPPRNLDDPHWMSSGVEWESFLCSPTVSGFIGECPPVTGNAPGFTKEISDEGLNFCSAEPFVVYGSFECSTGGRPVNETFEIAEKRLEAWEQWSVERILWTGQTVNGQINPSFALGNDECGITPVNLSPNGPLSPSAALAVLEQNLANLVPCGGMIHAPYGMATFLASDSLVERVGDKFFTTTGVQVVFGAGYSGSGPNNAAPTAGSTWMFATGPMVIARSEIIRVPRDPSEAINRRVNQIEARAERFYVVGFDCGLLAVETKLSCSCC